MMFYIKSFFVALYDVCIISFDGGIFGNTKKVHLLLYCCYTAFYGFLAISILQEIKKKLPALAAKKQKIKDRRKNPTA